MTFVGQEFGMCLGTMMGKQVWVAAVGAGVLAMPLCSHGLWASPADRHMGYLGLPQSLAASGLLGSFHGDVGSGKQGGGCTNFSNLITGVMWCHFFLIRLQQECYEHASVQRAGNADPSFQWENYQGSHCRSAFVIDDIVAAILENTLRTVVPLIKMYVLPPGKMHTLPPLGHLLPLRF